MVCPCSVIDIPMFYAMDKVIVLTASEEKNSSPSVFVVSSIKKVISGSRYVDEEELACTRFETPPSRKSVFVYIIITLLFNLGCKFYPVHTSEWVLCDQSWSQ